jgi:hypothetical protein
VTGEVVRMSGGWNGSARSAMSPGTLRLVAQLEQAQECRDVQEAAKREAAAQEFQARSEALAVQQAIEHGEAMRDALTGRGVGRTRQEFLSMVSAEMDLADAQAQARERQEFRRWQAGHGGDWAAWAEANSGNMSAPTEVEIAEQQTRAAYGAEYRRKRREASKIIQAARRFAA